MGSDSFMYGFMHTGFFQYSFLPIYNEKQMACKSFGMVRMVSSIFHGNIIFTDGRDLRAHAKSISMRISDHGGAQRKLADTETCKV